MGNVLMVANYEPDVGYAWNFIQQFWVELAKKYPGRCHLAYPRRGVVPAVITDAGITVHWQDMREKGSAAFIRQHRIEHVYLTDWTGLNSTYALWRLAGVKDIVVHDHVPGDPPPARGWRGAVKASLNSLRLISPTQCLAVAEHVTQRHIDTWRMDPNRCVTVTNGISPFAVDISLRPSVRRELKLPLDAKAFLIVGRATQYKGIDFAVRCLARLPPHVHFVHIGDGPNLEEFRTLARDLDVTERMHFLGKRLDVQRVMAGCDAAFHPSRGEAMSLAILEYMCGGLAPVVPSLPSVSVAVENQVTGLIYPNLNLDGAVSALGTLADDDDLRTQLGSAARAKVLSSYTIEQTMRTFGERIAFRA
jgi:glycosyltransferase involved in cell wall biosynthesis